MAANHQGGCGYWSKEFSHDEDEEKDDGDVKDGRDDDEEHED